MTRGVPFEILVIDDAPMFRELEMLFLSGSGEVSAESDGAAGLARARRDRPDVVVVDFEMPELSGLEVCRAIKSDPELTNTAVIVVTGGENPDDRARAVLAGANDVLSKPINRVSLIQAVNRFSGSSRVGLERVSVTTPVRIALQGGQAQGVARNLSRGGIFVEVGQPLTLREEVQLSFELPDSPNPSPVLQTSAKVVWSREQASRASAGLGLQFLALDRASAERIEEYIYERSDTAPAQSPLSSPGQSASR